MKKIKLFVQHRVYMALFDAVKKKTGHGLILGKLVSFISDEVIKNERIGSSEETIFCGAKFFVGAKPTRSLEEDAIKYDRLSMEVVWSLGYDLSITPMYPKDDDMMERGVDVDLACDAIRGAMNNEFQVAVLFVSDTDYGPLVKHLNNLGVITYVVAIDRWGIYTSAILKRDASCTIELGDILDNDEATLDSILFR